MSIANSAAFHLLSGNDDAVTVYQAGNDPVIGGKLGHEIRTFNRTLLGTTRVKLNDRRILAVEICERLGQLSNNTSQVE